VAFGAGLISFLSPCVLPLVPGYLSFVTGERAVPQAERRRLLPVLAFILGFTVVFTVLFGFTASALSRAWPDLREPSHRHPIAPIAADCTVEATFTLITFTVTPSASANGSISPSSPQLVPLGQTASFDVAPDFGFEATVGGTCGVTHTGLHYTTRAITADCTVVATFPALPRYTVTPSASAHGSLTPNLPFVLIAGQSASASLPVT